MPVGSFSQTQHQLEQYYDLDFGELKTIEYFDIWNTVELNGANKETLSSHFKNFSVFISNTPFTGTTFAESKAQAGYEYIKNATITRKFSKNNLGVSGRYMRIHSFHPEKNKLKFAEIEVIGRTFETTLSIDKEKGLAVNLYPNPTKNSINIKFSKPQTNVLIEITNVLGQRITSKTYASVENINLNIKGATGVYFITIKGDDNLNLTKKIIKN